MNKKRNNRTQHSNKPNMIKNLQKLSHHSWSQTPNVRRRMIMMENFSLYAFFGGQAQAIKRLSWLNWINQPLSYFDHPNKLHYIIQDEATLAKCVRLSRHFDWFLKRSLVNLESFPHSPIHSIILLLFVCFFFFWLVLLFRKKKNFLGWVKTYNCIVFTNLHYTN